LGDPPSRYIFMCGLGTEKTKMAFGYMFNTLIGSYKNRRDTNYKKGRSMHCSKLSKKHALYICPPGPSKGETRLGEVDGTLLWIG